MEMDDAAPLLSARGAILGDARLLRGGGRSPARASLTLELALGRSPQFRPLFFAGPDVQAAGTRGGYPNVRAWLSRSVPASCPPKSFLGSPLAFAANASSRTHTLRLPVPPAAFECPAGGGGSGGGSGGASEVHTVFFVVLRVDLTTERLHDDPWVGDWDARLLRAAGVLLSAAAAVPWRALAADAAATVLLAVGAGLLLGLALKGRSLLAERRRRAWQRQQQ
ncbi:hypothetical protein GPECTOR_248g613 [Gonium pectorale]|uniref:Uncharacterized protein n=1 Tax=Gonium pectorale TaxID=33097 RepID=A0A150FWA5_GONPE|nr:hypothetical protein GPECTOR_248g613 [Gonium pectorale]|eukprot:KXZ41904.1 hypothetical protein GPECTOR_248g613 [Gonium pectorale]